MVFPPDKIAEEEKPVVIIANANVNTAMKIAERIKNLCLKADVVYEDQMCDIPEINNGKNAFHYLEESIHRLEETAQLIPIIERYILYVNKEVISIESRLNYPNKKEEYKGKWVTYCREVRRLLHIYGVDDYPLVRVGGKHDGGYIMLDDFEKTQFAYSFGISDDISWDEDIAGHGIHVFMYDHTIEDLPVQNEQFHFFKKGIAETDKPDEQLYSLKTFICKNNHEKEKNIILKMDVEGAEWDVFEAMEPDILKKFDQIVLELHSITIMDEAPKIRKVLKKLNMTHAVVHVHGNNYASALSDGKGIMPDSLEVTYANRAVYRVKEIDNVDLPIMIDERCYCERDEFYLRKWNDI